MALGEELSALKGMGATLREFQDIIVQLNKELGSEPTTQDPKQDLEPTPEPEPAPGTPAATLKDAQAKLAELQKMAAEGKEIVQTELDALTALLQPLRKEEETDWERWKKMLWEVGEMAYSLASDPPGGPKEILGSMAAKLSELATMAGVSDTVAKDVDGVLTDGKMALADVPGLLRDTAIRAHTVAKMVDGKPTDAIKQEIVTMRDTLETAKGGLPVQTSKATRDMMTSIRETTERAMHLSLEAGKAGYNDSEALRELNGATRSLTTLCDKYADIKKSEDFQLSDLSIALEAGSMLRRFEDGLKAFLVKQEPTETPQPEPVAKEEPKVEPKEEPKEEPKTDPAPAPVAKEEPKTDPPTDDLGKTVATLASTLDALKEQINGIQATIAKSRDQVDPPASQDETPTQDGGGDNDLFPMDYNA